MCLPKDAPVRRTKIRLKFGLTQFQGFDVGYKLLCSGRLQPNGLTKFDGLILRPTLDGLLINESAENSQVSKTRKAEHGRPVADDCDLIVFLYDFTRAH